MNIQAMMKQAQQIQKEMLNAKNEIDNKIYTATSSYVTVSMKGNKKIEKIDLNIDNLDKEDIEITEDLLVVAINDVLTQIDTETEAKMGKYTKGMPGLF